MKKSICLFVCFIYGTILLLSQSRFTVENVYGDVKAVDGATTYDALEIGTKLSCNTSLNVGMDGSVTISHPDLPTMVFKNAGKFMLKDRVIELGIVSDCEVKAKDQAKGDAKVIIPDEYLKLSRPYTGILVPGIVKVTWEKPKLPGSFTVEVVLPDDKENPLVTYNTDNTFLDLNMKAFELTIGREYCLILKSTNKKLGATEAKFTTGDFEVYKKLVNDLKAKKQYLSANFLDKELMEADLLEKSNYLYLAATKYEKLKEKFPKNDDFNNQYKEFYSRMQLN